MKQDSSIALKLIAVLISGILAFQYIPVTFNGKTVIIQIGCCKDLSDCCASGVQACTMHTEHGETGAYSSCQASSDTSDYMMVISKSVIPEATQIPISLSGIYVTPISNILSPQGLADRLFRPPQPSFTGKVRLIASMG